MKLGVNFKVDKRIKLTLKETDQSFRPKCGEIQKVVEYVGGDLYEGDYEVTPKVTGQTMATKDKVLTEDVKIKAIPFFNVSNTSGGNTVYIANEV